MNTEKLEKNREYVKQEFDKLLNIYPNKYILVHDQQIINSFDSYESAVEEGIKNFGIDGDFLVHFITEQEVINFLSVANL